MATMNVVLPERMKAWVDAQTATGRYTDASDYVRDLIRRDQERADAIADLQHAIDEGFESGISERAMSDVMNEAREKVQAALGS